MRTTPKPWEQFHKTLRAATPPSFRQEFAAISEEIIYVRIPQQILRDISGKS